MSTIEKAAARLAGRRASQGRSSAPTPDAGGERADASGWIAPVPGGTNPQGEGGSRAAAPARFCDLDLRSLQANGFLTPDTPRNQLSQEMRRIKRPLLLNLQKPKADSIGPPPNLIMVTSALSGEGKTFLSINLAMSMAAELDRRVLLVDADVAMGGVSSQFGITRLRGLSDLLQEGQYLAEDGVLHSNVEHLSILPAGSKDEHIDELYASDLMGEICRSLAEIDPHRIVIFDSAPLLATTEAAVMARWMGQIVLVVEANKTHQEAVTQAIAALEGCPNISLVLNKTTGKSSSSYGYGYGYGSEHASEVDRGAPGRQEAN